MIFFLILAAITFFSVIESIHFNLPVVSSTRRVSFFIVLFSLVVLTIFRKTARTTIIRLSTSFSVIAVFIYFFLIFFVSSFQPLSTDPHTFFYYAASFLSFVFFLIAAAATNRPRSLIKTVILAVISATALLSLVSLTMLILPDTGITLIQKLFSENIWEYILFDYYRGRFYPAGILSAVSISILYLLIGKNKFGVREIVVLFWWQIISFAVILSNYRSHVLTMLMGILLISLGFVKHTRNKLLGKALMLVPTTSLLVIILLAPNNFIKRMLFIDPNDYLTLKARINFLSDGWKIFSEFPIAGVGLGNYGYYSYEIVNYSSGGGEKPVVQAGDPHNILFLILAERGIVGLAGFIFLIYALASHDLSYLRRFEANTELKMLIVLSWTFIVGINLDSFSMHGWNYFFLLRGVIAGSVINPVKVKFIE